MKRNLSFRKQAFEPELFSIFLPLKISVKIGKHTFHLMFKRWKLYSLYYLELRFSWCNFVLNLKNFDISFFSWGMFGTKNNQDERSKCVGYESGTISF